MKKSLAFATQLSRVPRVKRRSLPLKTTLDISPGWHGTNPGSIGFQPVRLNRAYTHWLEVWEGGLKAESAQADEA